jgi:hypothetical protein
MKRELNRRSVLSGLTAAGIVGVAGCSGFQERELSLPELLDQEIETRSSDLSDGIDLEGQYREVNGYQIDLDSEGGNEPHTDVILDVDTDINFDSYDSGGDLLGEFEDDYAEIVRDVTTQMVSQVQETYGERSDIEAEDRFNGSLLDTQKDMPEIGDVLIRFSGRDEKFAWDRLEPETFSSDSYSSNDVMEDYHITK